MNVKLLHCRARVLILGFAKGHDWKSIGAGTFRVCRRCGENGWAMPATTKESARA